MLGLFSIYFKRIFSLCLALQVVFSVSFAMVQVPSFLVMIRGLNFGVWDLIIILSLRVWDWINFITIVAFIISMLIVFLEDISNNITVLFLQVGKGSAKIFEVMFLTSFVYGLFFMLNELFLVPYGSIYLKEKIFEIYKENLIYSIKPKHIVEIKDFNVTVASRSGNSLKGFLIHSSRYKTTFLFDKIDYDKKKDFKFKSSSALGKVSLDEDEIFINIGSSSLVVDSNLVMLKKNKLKYYEIRSIKELFERIKIFILSLLIAFWLFVLFFSNKIFYSIGSSVCFLTLLFNVIEMYSITPDIFVILSLLIYIFYRKTSLCLNF